MTKTLAVNEKNDIYLGKDGNIVVATGEEAVSNACLTASQALLQEMIYSTNKGLPYFQSVFVGSPDYAIFRNSLISTLLAVDGVLNVQSLSLTVVEGVLNYSATILTRYGRINLGNG